jgi:hypothetical protein
LVRNPQAVCAGDAVRASTEKTIMVAGITFVCGCCGPATSDARPTYSFRATNVELILAGTALLGVFVVLDGLRWNRFTYPRRMDTWSSSYFCVRCSRVTILRPVAN